MATTAAVLLQMPAIDRTKAILDAALISGCREPSPADFDHIFTAIEERFSTITQEEFLLAFRLNSYGEYRSRTEHYNLFCMDYVVQVLNAFSEYRAGTMLKSAKEELRIAEEQKEQQQRNKAESRLNMIASINMDFNLYRDNPDTPIKLEAVKCDWLIKNGYLPEPTDQEKKEYKILAVEKRKKSLLDSRVGGGDPYRTIKSILEQHESGNLTDMEAGMIVVIAKGICLRKWFDTLIDFPK